MCLFHVIRDCTTLPGTPSNTVPYRPNVFLMDVAESRNSQCYFYGNMVLIINRAMAAKRYREGYTGPYRKCIFTTRRFCKLKKLVQADDIAVIFRGSLSFSAAWCCALSTKTRLVLLQYLHQLYAVTCQIRSINSVLKRGAYTRSGVTWTYILSLKRSFLSTAPYGLVITAKFQFINL